MSGQRQEQRAARAPGVATHDEIWEAAVACLNRHREALRMGLTPLVETPPGWTAIYTWGWRDAEQRAREELRVVRETASLALLRLDVLVDACIAYCNVTSDDYDFKARKIDFDQAVAMGARTVEELQSSGEPRRDDAPAGPARCDCGFPHASESWPPITGAESSVCAPEWAAVEHCQHSAQSWYRDASGVHCEDCEAASPADIHDHREEHAPAGGGGCLP